MDKERDLLPWALGAVLLTTVAAAASASVPPANQIWECNSGGRRVFADSPCGAHAAIRELSPINTMAAPNPAAVYYPAPSSVYEPDAANEAADSQPLGAVYYYNGVARRHHPARHGGHLHGPRGSHR